MVEIQRGTPLNAGLIEQVKNLLDLFDNHDVIKKAYQDAYRIRRNQLVEVIRKAEESE